MPSWRAVQCHRPGAISCTACTLIPLPVDIQETQDLSGVVRERGCDLGRQAPEGLEDDLAVTKAPPGCGAPVAEGERTEAALDGDEVAVRAEEPLPRRPAEENRLEGAEELRRRDRRRGRTAGQVDEAVFALGQLRRDRGECRAGVAQWEARPSGEIAVARRALSREVAARELSKCAVAIDGTGLAEPVADEHVGMLPADHGPADDQAAKGAQHQEVHERLALRRYAGAVDLVAQLRACERPFFRQPALDHANAALRLLGRHALLG